jgi:hypothetical protein
VKEQIERINANIECNLQSIARHNNQLERFMAFKRMIDLKQYDQLVEVIAE